MAVNFTSWTWFRVAFGFIFGYSFQHYQIGGTTMADGLLKEAWRKVVKANRAYLNGPVSQRKALRASYRAAALEYERLRRGKDESLARRCWRLTKG